MKLIDLLVLISKGEKLPTKIKVFNQDFRYDEKEKTYLDENGFGLDDYDVVDYLNEDMQVEWQLNVKNMNISCSNYGMTFEVKEGENNEYRK